MVNNFLHFFTEFLRSKCATHLAFHFNLRAPSDNHLLGGSSLPHISLFAGTQFQAKDFLAYNAPMDVH
jgi:hypothetical protein